MSLYLDARDRTSHILYTLARHCRRLLAPLFMLSWTGWRCGTASVSTFDPPSVIQHAPTNSPLNIQEDSSGFEDCPRTPAPVRVAFLQWPRYGHMEDWTGYWNEASIWSSRPELQSRPLWQVGSKISFGRNPVESRNGFPGKVRWGNCR